MAIVNVCGCRDSLKIVPLLTQKKCPSHRDAVPQTGRLRYEGIFEFGLSSEAAWVTFAPERLERSRVFLRRNSKKAIRN